MKILIMCATIMLTSHCVEAKVDYKNKGVTYEEAVELGRKSLSTKLIPVVVCREKPERLKKSVRKIMQEILNHRKVEKVRQELYKVPTLDLDFDNTIPIPVPYIRNLKNLA